MTTKRIPVVLSVLSFVFTLIFLLSLYFAVSSFAAEQSWGKWGRTGKVWSLVSSAITSSGDSATMVDGYDCDSYAMYIRASGGTVNIAMDVYESGDGSGFTKTASYTLSAAGDTGYTWEHPTPYLKLTFTITSGQVDGARVFCFGR